MLPRKGNYRWDTHCWLRSGCCRSCYPRACTPFCVRPTAKSLTPSVAVSHYSPISPILPSTFNCIFLYECAASLVYAFSQKYILFGCVGTVLSGALRIVAMPYETRYGAVGGHNVRPLATANRNPGGVSNILLLKLR